MINSLLHSSSVRRFAETAQQYVTFIDSRDSLSRGELLRQTQVLLPALYSAALELPDAEPSDEEHEGRLAQEQWTELCQALEAKIGDRDRYNEIFDPYNSSDVPVTASLSDDLADIYRDLLEGLSFWRQAQTADAVWAWRFNFETHWGEHATGALRAIHTLAYSYDLHESGSTQAGA